MIEIFSKPLFALPVKNTKVPTADAWFHEIKYDGYRMMVVRDGDLVRLISKGGHDYAKRFPWIVEAARKNRQRRFVIDGEAVLLGVNGISDFDGLHSGKYNDEVQFYAFDILAIGDDDLRRLPLSLRKQNLARLLARRPDGIFVAEFEQGEIGPDLFRKACEFNLEGLVSKHGERAYSAGRCNHWIKVKNPKHPAYRRVQDQF
jgi:bifunctional non-homologous end joining protein LigD